MEEYSGFIFFCAGAFFSSFNQRFQVSNMIRQVASQDQTSNILIGMNWLVLTLGILNGWA